MFAILWKNDILRLNRFDTEHRSSIFTFYSFVVIQLFLRCRTDTNGGKIGRDPMLVNPIQQAIAPTIQNSIILIELLVMNLVNVGMQNNGMRLKKLNS